MSEVYHRLTVIKKSLKTYWHCRCECGAEKVVRVWDLKNGYVKSCGCLRREVAIQNLSGRAAERVEGRRCELCGGRADSGYRRLPGGGLLCRDCTHTARGRRYYRRVANV